jgi:hypothetical protein
MLGLRFSYATGFNEDSSLVGCYAMLSANGRFVVSQDSPLLWQHNVTVRPVAMLKFVAWQQGVVCTSKGDVLTQARGGEGGMAPAHSL